MSNDIKSALTAEQWAANRFGFEHWGEVQAHSDGALTVRDTVNQPAIFRGEDRHALAAIALHKQSFGFTRADVKLLSEEGWLLLDEGAINERRRRLLDIAERIAALLPPEQP